MKSHTLLFVPIAFFIGLSSCNEKKDEHSTMSSLADLKVYDGLEVTLFASEPMLTNPTNIDVDSKGRVWVCEAYNYRNQYNSKNPLKKEGDRILILEDTDGDGKADKSKVFYQGLDVNAALGISVLGNKVIVSCSPNVLVFTDENGDGVPDKKEILFKGIQGVDHDHGMHAFIFGPDGRLYFNMGNEGKNLVSASGDTVVDIHGHNVSTNGKPFRDGLVLRSELDGTRVEVLAHNFRNNYEVTVDPFGTLWQSDNDDDGNKGTRINFVMEFGNYGFKDEMTGASWPARRTNMEKEIPLRHWHLNDPGVVPNLLQTFAGSPTGITMYEGTLLPEVFRGQIIHSDAGPNVVRAYPVQNDGAGYKAEIVSVLQGQKDQWFRPSDVCVAPDGSLLVADWYDPGVGGHQVGDLNRGRIYRVAPPKTPYNIQAVDVTTPEGAASALLSPNPATRYLGWIALNSIGEKSEAALQKIWSADNVRNRARALWLLARFSKGDEYIMQSLEDKSSDIRITGIRVSRQLNKDMIAVVAKLLNDPSAQVRRELIIALRESKSPHAADLWTKLALQYKGNDRWYLEALGIGAQGSEELFFAEWKSRVGKEWNTPANSDIVWRSRSKDAMPLLAELIRKSTETEMLRYYRAFDFQTDPSKQQVLAQLVQQTQGDKVLYALKHMNPAQVKMTPALAASLNKVLEQQKGKIEFVELVATFKLQNRANDLLSLGVNYPDSIQGKDAVKVLLDWNKIDLFQKVLSGSNKAEALALVKALRPGMGNTKAITLMENIMLDSTKDLELRKLAVKNFGGRWESENRLLELAKENKIPKDLYVAAGGVFQTAWRSTLRDEGAKYIRLPGHKAGTVLPAISMLVEKVGDVAKGKEVFSTACANCHQVNGVGVDFGPALSEIGSKLPKEALYTSILYPDQGISFGYEGYQFQLKDGSTAFGKIVSETSDMVVVQYMNNQQSIVKGQIVSRMKLENSLMSSNLQSAMSEQELIDLVEYLSGLKAKIERP
jgi:putative membrane-bound dehydrogenase-like protein